MNAAAQPHANANAPTPDQAAWGSRADAGETIQPQDYQDTAQADPVASSTGTGSRWLKVGLASLVGLGLGWAGLLGIEAMRGHSAPAAPVVVQGPAPLSAAPVVVQTAPAPAMQASLQATLVMGARTYNLGADQVALPTGSRFQISVVSPQTGQLSILAVNPQGQASAAPLWSGHVVAGQNITSGVLRLEGSQGRETLLIRLQPANGAAPLTHSAHLWHL